MKTLTLNAKDREITKKQVKSLRKIGTLPAAIFGYKGNFNIQLDNKEFSKIYSEAGHTTVVDIKLDDKVHSVLINEVQINPLTRDFIHVSLREVRMDEEITAEIPFVLIGAEESPAVKDEQSLVILSQNFTELKGLPRNLPSEITIDVSGFHAGDTLTLKDIKLPEGISVVREEELEAVIVTTASAVQEEIIEDVQAAIDADAAEKNAEEGVEGAEGGEGAAPATEGGAPAEAAKPEESKE